MGRLLSKYLSREDGAIAVETAIVAPILLFILLPAIDIGMQIHALQKMNKATDSGIEYVVNGGRDKATLRSIVQDSFGEYISEDELEIAAYCGCVEASSNQGDANAEELDPQAGFYVKTSTTFEAEMCPTLCSNGQAPSELVELNLNRTVGGVLRSKSVSSRLQTRIK